MQPFCAQVLEHHCRCCVVCMTEVFPTMVQLLQKVHQLVVQCSEVHPFPHQTPDQSTDSFQCLLYCCSVLGPTALFRSGRCGFCSFAILLFLQPSFSFFPHHCLPPGQQGCWRGCPRGLKVPLLATSIAFPMLSPAAKWIPSGSSNQQFALGNPGSIAACVPSF